MSIDILKYSMTKQDGRTLRSVKSQKLIVKACIKLFKEGNFVPTAQLVANESGVGIRTVFRLFDDMENLLKSVDAEMRKDYDFEVKFDPNSAFENRLLVGVDHLCAVYEKHQIIMFGTISNMWKYKFLQENYMNYQKMIMQKVEEVLPEVLNFDGELQELTHATLSFAFWMRLQGQGLKKDQINSAMVRQCMMIFKSQ
ncbi:hypothetical protein N8317_00365 [Gammaproteobacteria bacterium]|nr:hypothetical protein [Gammaproteobacteria bacterium]